MTLNDSVVIVRPSLVDAAKRALPRADSDPVVCDQPG